MEHGFLLWFAGFLEGEAKTGAPRFFPFIPLLIELHSLLILALCSALCFFPFIAALIFLHCCAYIGVMLGTACSLLSLHSGEQAKGHRGDARLIECKD